MDPGWIAAKPLEDLKSRMTLRGTNFQYKDFELKKKRKKKERKSAVSLK